MASFAAAESRSTLSSLSLLSLLLARIAQHRGHESQMVDLVHPRLYACDRIQGSGYMAGYAHAYAVGILCQSLHYFRLEQGIQLDLPESRSLVLRYYLLRLFRR